MLLAERLAENNHLNELIFTETADHQKYWTAQARQMFTQTLKTSTQLKVIKARFQESNKELTESKLFLEEIEFYTEQKSKQKSKAKGFEDRMHSCD